MLSSKKGLLDKTKKVQDQFANLLDLPQDALLDLPRITIIGDKQLYLENHRGIIEYSPERIRVSVAGGQLEITGQNFSLKNIKADEIAVEGKILGLVFNH